MVNTKSLYDIVEMDAAEIIEKISNGTVSITGCFETSFRSKMTQNLIKLLCGHFSKKITRHTKNDYRPYIDDRQIVLRGRMLQLLSRYAPVSLYGQTSFNHYAKEAIIVGFNHPSLGEIIRLLGVFFEAYPNKQILFPVNIEWFEILAKYDELLYELGVLIVPLITPSTIRHFEEKNDLDESVRKSIAKINMKFQRYYLESCKFCAAGGGIIAVAPSATRQATIFPSKAAYEQEQKIPAIVELIVHAICSEKCDFRLLPICVIPPKSHNKGLGLFKNYDFYVSDSFSKQEVVELRAHGQTRVLDYLFLRRIADASEKLLGKDNQLLYP